MLRSALHLPALALFLVTGLNPALAQRPVAPKAATAYNPAMIVESYRTLVDFQEDGTGVRDLTVVVQVLQDSALKGLSVLVFGYSGDSEAVTVEQVQVRKADGTLVTTPPENVQDVAPAGTGPYHVYSDAREKHVAVKSLAVGDTLAFHVRWRMFKAIIPGQFSGEFEFPVTDVVKEKVVQITFPAGRTYQVAGRAPQVTEAGGRKTLRWVHTNPVAQIPPARAPWAGQPAPAVVVTTLNSWAELGAWYRGLSGPQEAVTPAVRAKAKALTEGLATDRDRVKALYAFVSTQIQYLGLSFGIGRFQPHAAGEVLANGYGDCKDKHTLLASLLKACGLEAWPALMRAGGEVNPAAPTHTQFDHVITVVPLGAEWLWLDATPEVAPFGYLGANLRGRPALVMPAKGPAMLRDTPVALPYPQETLFTFKGRLEEGGRLQGHCALSLRGDAELPFRQALRQIPQARWAQFLTQTSSPAGLAYEFTAIAASPSTSTERPFALDWELAGVDSTNWKRRRMTVPLIPAGLERALQAGPRPVDSIFVVPKGITYTSRAAVELPASAQPNLPAPVQLSSQVGVYTAVYGFDGGVLTVERRLTLRGGEILPKDRKAFSDFVQAMTDDEARYVDLGGRGPDLARETPETVALFNQGVEALNRQDAPAAREAFRRVLERSPAFPGAHRNHAFTYLMKNDLQPAIRELLKEEELHPEDATTYVLLGRVYEHLGQKAGAIAQWQSALAQDPDAGEAATLLVGLLHKEKRHREAAAVLEQRVARNPGSAEDLVALAEDYGSSGQQAKVAPTLTKAVGLGATPDVLARSARALLEAGQDPAQATAWADQARALLDAEASTLQDPERGVANTTYTWANWTTLGRLHLQAGRPQEALRFLKAAWSVGHNAGTGLALAQTFEQLGRRKEAAEHYELAAVANNPDRATIAQKYKKLTGRTLENGAGHFFVKGKMLPSPLDHLMALRTATFPIPKAGGTLRAILILSGPGAVEAVRLLDQPENFPEQAAAAKALRLPVVYPDATPRRLFIAGGIQFAGTKGTFIALAD